ncbi:MAG: TorF family putative porin, partial [Sedimenticolaceae bacterium]
MKKTTLALAMGLMISGAANAAVEANIGATSNYVWRGVTQTSDDATLQGGVDYSNEEGFSLGAWASDVKPVNGYEFDIYGA